MFEKLLYPQPLHRLRDVPGKAVDQNVAGIFNYAVPLVQEKSRSRIFPPRRVRVMRTSYQKALSLITKVVEAAHIQAPTLRPTPVRITWFISPARFGKNSPMKTNEL